MCALVRIAFDALGLHRVQASIVPRNVRSVRVRRRARRPTAEVVGYGPRTEQWVWQTIPIHLDTSAVPSAALPGRSWEAAAWGIGVPLFLPEPVKAPPPMIIGHRGAPGYLPDHTLEGYTLAIEQGADAIEPDLVITKDGALICRHENELSGTTDVAEKFPERRRTALIDGETIDGWFAEDYTLAEIQTLRARQPWPERSHDHDGEFTVPTFDQVVELARKHDVLVIPETKHPTYFRALGLPLEDAMLAVLEKHNRGYRGAVIQSFELSNLEALAARTGLLRLLLVGDPRSVLPHDTRTGVELLADLPALRTRVGAIGVSRELVWGPDGSTGLLERAHLAGLKVYVYTFRTERGSDAAEIARFLGLGVDGIFADQPDVAVRARAGG